MCQPRKKAFCKWKPLPFFLVIYKRNYFSACLLSVRQKASHSLRRATQYCYNIWFVVITCEQTTFKLKATAVTTAVTVMFLSVRMTTPLFVLMPFYSSVSLRDQTGRHFNPQQDVPALNVREFSTQSHVLHYIRNPPLMLTHNECVG